MMPKLVPLGNHHDGRASGLAGGWASGAGGRAGGLAEITICFASDPFRLRGALTKITICFALAQCRLRKFSKLYKAVVKFTEILKVIFMHFYQVKNITFTVQSH